MLWLPAAARAAPAWPGMGGPPPARHGRSAWCDLLSLPPCRTRELACAYSTWRLYTCCASVAVMSLIAIVARRCKRERHCGNAYTKTFWGAVGNNAVHACLLFETHPCLFLFETTECLFSKDACLFERTEYCCAVAYTAAHACLLLEPHACLVRNSCMHGVVLSFAPSPFLSRSAHYVCVDSGNPGLHLHAALPLGFSLHLPIVCSSPSLDLGSAMFLVH